MAELSGCNREPKIDDVALHRKFASPCSSTIPYYMQESPLCHHLQVVSHELNLNPNYPVKGGFPLPIKAAPPFLHSSVFSKLLADTDLTVHVS